MSSDTLMRGGRARLARRPYNEPVRANAVRDDLALLRTMILWATRERKPMHVALVGEPLRGVKLPREENPMRPVATYDRFVKVRAAMQELATQEPSRTRWVRMELALVLAEATGARIGAIRGLRWSDVAFDPASICFRAKFDKRGRERVVPIPSRWRRNCGASGCGSARWQMIGSSLCQE